MFSDNIYKELSKLTKTIEFIKPMVTVQRLPVNFNSKRSHAGDGNLRNSRNVPTYNAFLPMLGVMDRRRTFFLQNSHIHTIQHYNLYYNVV